MASIRQSYEELGHSLGWRFLYSPRRTLSPSTRLAFVGLNPGGSVYEPPIESVEAGNAYRVERWGRGGTLGPLQVQIALLFEALGGRVSEDPDALLDETLSVNFCPFRSPSWDRLVRPAESVEFSRTLWQSILDLAEPRAIVCLGALAERCLRDVFQQRGLEPAQAPTTVRVGWGEVSLRMTTYAGPASQVLLVRLPHLSRFGFLGRPGAEDATARLTSGLADVIR